MTIIDFMRQKLTEYPKKSEFLVDGDIHVDFTSSRPQTASAGGISLQTAAMRPMAGTGSGRPRTVPAAGICLTARAIC